MPGSAKTYRKHNSFVEIRQRGTLPDPHPRLTRLLEKEGSWNLPPHKTAVVRAAISDLLSGQGRFTLHVNVQEELARLRDNELPRYLFYRYRYEVFPEQKILDQFPPCVQVEPTSICNFRCVFCYQTDPELTNKQNGHMGIMSLDTFKRIIDQLEGEVEAVTLASRGEPLVCPDIGKMLAFARGKFLAFKLNTNASLLTEAKCHSILESDISTLVFSADAANEPHYSQLRVGGTLQKTLKNVQMFAEIKRKSYPKSRMITRVSGVQVEGSGDLQEMEQFWGDYVDQVAFVNYNPWENAYEAPFSEVEAPCSDLWRRLFVWWDGRANPCDVDYRSSLAVGNAKNAGISHIWRSPAYDELRAKHLERERGSISPCNRCTVV